MRCAHFDNQKANALRAFSFEQQLLHSMGPSAPAFKALRAFHLGLRAHFDNQFDIKVRAGGPLH